MARLLCRGARDRGDPVMTALSAAGILAGTIAALDLFAYGCVALIRLFRGIS